jgi:hypothetical protein
LAKEHTEKQGRRKKEEGKMIPRSGIVCFTPGNSQSSGFEIFGLLCILIEIRATIESGKS